MKKLSTLTVFVLVFLTSLSLKAVPKLNSLPSAPATIFLDFDGHYVVSGVWNGGMPITCAAAALSTTQITNAFNRVAEDYRPFDINITTDSTVFIAAPFDKRIRIIITPTSSWYPGVGGIAWIGSFVWGDDTPAFVFSDKLGPNNVKYIAECCSHESGHSVGLSHQSKYDGVDCTNPLEAYNSGQGTGEQAWAPVMGNGYYRNMTNWNNGPTPYGCTSVQDNLSIITSYNGFGFRPDDYGDVIDNSAYKINAVNFNIPGIISTNTDKDVFKITFLKSNSIYLTVMPFSAGTNNDGANLDIKVELYNGAGTLLNTYNPLTTMSATIDTGLVAGTYYIVVDGTGNANIGEYGSLGAYTISGITGVLPIKDVTLSGSIENNKHTLQWTIISDEQIQSVTVETAEDGIWFNTLSNVPITNHLFKWQPVYRNSTWYRVRVISVAGQIKYSNIISLKQTAAGYNNFTVSTFINSEIIINASVPYQYQLTTINGSIAGNGNGKSGTNRLNIRNQPAGVYILKIISNNKQQTERIIKQ